MAQHSKVQQQNEMRKGSDVVPCGVGGGALAFGTVWDTEFDNLNLRVICWFMPESSS